MALAGRLPARQQPSWRCSRRSSITVGSRPVTTSSLGDAASSATERPRLVLGIETSCDDTAAAVVRSDGKVLGEALATQAELNAQWGGVVPKLAMEAHQAAIDKVVEEALAQAGVSAAELDAVAVTVGPGLSLCLRVGVAKATELCRAHGLPIVRVHHMEAHALVARLGLQHDVPFPFLCLLVSGGHNLLLLVQGVGQYVQLGTTLDDALGEAYDKVARLLALELRPHGGAALEAIAKEGDPAAFKFKVPMRSYKNCDFSYAGLKTSVRLAIERNLPELAELEAAGPGPSSEALAQQVLASTRQTRANIAASFQQVAVTHLMERMQRGVGWAREMVPGLRHVVVAGGVASNQYIRAQLNALCEREGLELVLPPPKWCTDNGVMVAWTGVERMALGSMEPPPPPRQPSPPGSSSSSSSKGEEAEEFFELRPRWPLTSERHPSSMPQERRGAKTARMHTSLTDMGTAGAAAAGAGAAAQT